MRFIILAIIAERPMHGYAIKDAVQTLLGDLWVPDRPQVYRLLALLEQEGMVVGHDQRVGRRPVRTVYEITTAGADALQDWFASAPQPASLIRDDVFVRLLFGSLVERYVEGGLSALLAAHTRAYRERLAALRNRRQAGARGGLLVDAAILRTEAELSALAEGGLASPSRRAPEPAPGREPAPVRGDGAVPKLGRWSKPTSRNGCPGTYGSPR